MHVLSTAMARVAVVSGQGPFPDTAWGRRRYGSRLWRGALGPVRYPLIQMVPFTVSSYEGRRYEISLWSHDEIAIWSRVDFPLPYQRVQCVPQNFLAWGWNTYNQTKTTTKHTRENDEGARGWVLISRILSTLPGFKVSSQGKEAGFRQRCSLRLVWILVFSDGPYE